ncbi:MAG: DUF4955 domain-containing protein [Thalassotalea sp.]
MKPLIKKSGQILLLISSIATLAFSTQAVESTLWQQFKTAKSNGSEPTLPDFSYAGYEYSEITILDTNNWKVFNVADFGASPDDDSFDDAGIQAAIDAAEANGKGIVQFEQGRYRVSPNNRVDQIITIQSDNILLKGKGTSASTGTVIFVAEPKVGLGSVNGVYGNPMFVFSPPDHELSRSTITMLDADAQRETFKIRVEDSSELNVGQKIVLWARTTDLTDDMFSGFPIGADWEGVNSNGIAIREIHTIKAINGNSITLREPLHITLKKSYDVSIRSINMLHNVGVENIRFVGNWPKYGEDFIHHKTVNGVRDDIHDYGWTAMKMLHVNNGWIKDVEFKDFNQNLAIRTSSAITVSQVKISGKKAHASIAISESYGILVKDSEDTAGHHHGPGVSQRNSGGVFLRYKMKTGQAIDSHGGGPYASLYDSVGKGNMDKNGGNQASYPHHLSHFVAWNFEMDSGPDSYDFWSTNQRNGHTFFQPYFVGLHGKNVSLKNSTLAANESQGSKVEPGSLFEAQLGLRRLPGFTYLGTEGGSKSFIDKVDIAFGTEGKYNFKYNVSGIVDFNTATFGDPTPGTKKVVYYRPAAPAEFFFTSKENENVVVTSLSIVKFGANGNYATKYNLQSDILCDRESFGSDPAPGVKKECFIQKISTPSGYSFKANEGATVNISAPINVAFGAKGEYIFKYNVTSDIPCTRAVFGSDPKPGVAKKCYIRAR